MAEFMGIIKEDNDTDHKLCWKCKSREVEDNALDCTYRLRCDLCYRGRKEKLGLKWMRVRKSELISCKFCLDAYRFKKKTEAHDCCMVGIQQCSLCAYQLNSSKSLKVHLKVAHDRFFCSVCNELFSELQDLKNHLESHFINKSYTCEFCKKSFSQSLDLKYHLRTHTKEKPFACDIHGKTFSQSLRVNHLKIQTGVNACDICKMVFSRSGDLKRHLRVHNGEKPFVCYVCKKAFSQSTNLKRHLITHKGEKPFSCDFCRKEFYQSAELKRHLTQHTGENSFEYELENLLTVHHLPWCKM